MKHSFGGVLPLTLQQPTFSFNHATSLLRQFLPLLSPTRTCTAFNSNEVVTLCKFCYINDDNI